MTSYPMATKSSYATIEESRDLLGILGGTVKNYFGRPKVDGNQIYLFMCIVALDAGLFYFLFVFNLPRPSPDFLITHSAYFLSNRNTCFNG